MHAFVVFDDNTDGLMIQKRSKIRQSAKVFDIPPTARWEIGFELIDDDASFAKDKLTPSRAGAGQERQKQKELMVIVVVLMTMMQQYKGVLESSQPGSNLWVPLIVELWPWSRQKDFPGRNQSVNSTPGSCSLNSVWILVWKGRHVAMHCSNSFARKSAYSAVWQLEVIGPLSKAGRSGYIQQTQTGTFERHLVSGRWVLQKNGPRVLQIGT